MCVGGVEGGSVSQDDAKLQRINKQEHSGNF